MTKLIRYFVFQIESNGSEVVFSITDPESGTALGNARLFLLLLSSEHFRHLHNKFSGVFRNLQMFLCCPMTIISHFEYYINCLTFLI